MSNPDMKPPPPREEALFQAVFAPFAVERQAFAIMDHPNLAKVFDAGSTVTSSLVQNPLNQTSILVRLHLPPTS